MTENHSDNPISQQPQPTSCNGVTISFLVAAGGFCWLGYHLGTAYGWLGGVLGLLLGIVAAVVATPVVLLLLMVFVHLVIKLEDAFKREA